MKRCVIYQISLCLLLLMGIPVRSVAQEPQQKSSIVSENPQQTIVLTYDGNQIHVKNAPIGSEAFIYNVLGVKVGSFRIDSTEVSYTLKIPRGFYIVKIGSFVRKLVVR